MIKNKYIDVLIPLEILGVSLQGISTKFKSEVEKKKGGGDLSGIVKSDFCAFLGGALKEC